jgi:hypothetical protein
MNICTFNQQQLSADGTQNTATTPMLFRYALYLIEDLLYYENDILINF